MSRQEYLFQHQKILYRTFKNALSRDQVSHAYLLSGEQGTPLYETALFLAKTLVCDDPHPLACETCWTCMRIDEGNYADLMILDGSKRSIKKDDVQILENQFEKTPMESKGKLIYLIHLVENMTAEAVNSLLKFLEEPHENVYAFLTTENEMKVLPTILSRVQKLPLKRISQQQIIQEAKEEELDAQDSELLSFFYNDADMIRKMSESEEYQIAHTCLNSFLEALENNPAEARYLIQTEIAPALKSKEMARFFLDLLSVVFQEILAANGKHSLILQSYDTIISNLATTLKNVDSSLYHLMIARGELDFNVNIPLLLDHLAIIMTKGDDSNGDQ